MEDLPIKPASGPNGIEAGNISQNTYRNNPWGSRSRDTGIQETSQGSGHNGNETGYQASYGPEILKMKKQNEEMRKAREEAVNKREKEKEDRKSELE